MSGFDWLQLVSVLGLVALATPLLGRYMTRVFEGERTLLSPFVGPIEKLTYRLLGENIREEMDARAYAKALLAFNFLGFLALFFLMLLQPARILNPQNLSGTSWHLALNTAVSFVTNTDWQSYSGENTLSYLTQMLGCTVQNFLSAATGFAVLLVLIRGLARKSTSGLGNFWQDITRSVLYILIPLSLILATIYASQGVIQNFDSSAQVLTLEGRTQALPQGPVASQIAIKELGTNGGGYFGANSAHPYENPTPLSNWLSILAMLLIPAGLTSMFGRMVGDRRQGWALFAAMSLLLVAGLAIGLAAEYQTNPVLHAAGVMEGKETRFGVFNSVLWEVITTATSNGSVNAMHSSFSPLSGGVAMLNIMLGEVVFGGIGSGLYGLLLFVLMTVFLSGLMVGRTPEYLGKKIEAREIQWTIIAIIAPCAAILFGTALSVALPAGLAGVSSKGPHAFSEILYAFSSAAGNNGSAFAGLNANSMYYNVALAFAMLVGRFAVLLPVIAIAGSLAKKKITPPSPGTFATDHWLFVVLLIGVVLVVGALTFFPALALGPVIEHVLMLQGRSF